jgi:hypothetical protein
VTRPCPKGSLLRDKAYLALIRQIPCLSCSSRPSQACHVRIGFNGTGIKPADSRTLPLCYKCHHKQHAMSEKKFWLDLQIDPISLCENLFAIYSDAKDISSSISAINMFIFTHRAAISDIHTTQID